MKYKHVYTIESGQNNEITKISLNIDDDKKIIDSSKFFQYVKDSFIDHKRFIITHHTIFLNK